MFQLLTQGFGLLVRDQQGVNLLLPGLHLLSQVGDLRLGCFHYDDTPTAPSPETETLFGDGPGKSGPLPPPAPKSREIFFEALECPLADFRLQIVSLSRRQRGLINFAISGRS